MKKIIIIALSTTTALFFSAVFGLSLYLKSLITEEFLVHQLESIFNARFDLEHYEIGILSGGSLEISGLSMAERDFYANQGTPLSKRRKIQNPSLTIKSINLNLGLFKILQGIFYLEGFVLKKPVIKLTFYSKGGNSLSHLFQSPKIVRSKLVKREKEPPLATAEVNKKTKASTEPFKAKNVPLAASLKEIGIKEAQLKVIFQQTGDSILVKDLNFLISNVEFDPNDLKNKNNADISFSTDIFVLSKLKKETTHLILTSKGFVVPFNKKTGQIDPEIVYGLNIKKASYISGLNIFEKLSGQIENLKKIGISIASLQEKAIIRNDTVTKVRYYKGNLKLLKDTIFRTEAFDFTIAKGFVMNLNSLIHSMEGEILVSKKESLKGLSQLDNSIQKKLNLDAKEAKEMRNKHFKNIIKNEQIFFPFQSKGTFTDSHLKLKTTLPDIGSFALDAGKLRLKQEGDKLKEKSRREVNKKVEEEKKKAARKLQEEAKKGLKNIFK